MISDATGLPLFPPAASVGAQRTDLIYFALLALSAAIILLVLVLVVGFAVRYRRGSKAKRGALPRWVSREVEVTWTAATLFLALFLFWWASSTQIQALAAPVDALEIHVVAKQWMWKTQAPNGAREINALHLPRGEPVRLVMSSQDVIHSFFVPAFRVKQDVLPGRATTLWFTPTRSGSFRIFCSQYCGTQHSHMTGEVIVMEPADYARWLGAQPQADDLAAQGAKLFRGLGCSGCHAPGAAIHAPNLAGVYGRAVPLADGRVITADEAYLRDSILTPRRDIAAGYEPLMPSFAGQIDEADVQSLVAYLKSLGSKGATAQ